MITQGTIMNCKLWPLKINNLQDAGNIIILSEIWSAAKSGVFHMTLLWTLILMFKFAEVLVINYCFNVWQTINFNLNIFDSTGWNHWGSGLEFRVESFDQYCSYLTLRLFNLGPFLSRLHYSQTKLEGLCPLGFTILFPWSHYDMSEDYAN